MNQRNIRLLRVDYLYRNGRYHLALQKWVFWSTKHPLLLCKNHTFGMQNSAFYNALIVKPLYEHYICERFLQHL